jgi:hypothetical protein
MRRFVVFGDSGQLVKGVQRSAVDDGTRSDLISSLVESAAVVLVESWGDCGKTLLMVHVSNVSEESAASSVSARRLILAAKPIWAGKSDIGPVYCSPRQLSVRSWSREVAVCWPHVFKWTCVRLPFDDGLRMWLDGGES